MTPYEKIKARCAADPEYRARYLAMQARGNQRARDKAKAKLTPEEIAQRREEGEARRVAAIKAAAARRAGGAAGAPRPDLPSWKKGKPGRIVALCGWSGWG